MTEPMSPPSTPARGWLVVPLAVLAAFAAFATWSAIDGRYAGWFSDSIDYLVLADFFRGAFGFDANNVAEAPALFRGTRFPPLYPIVLAIGGAGTAYQPEAFAVTSVLAVLAAVATLRFIHLAVPDGRAAALLGAAAIAPAAFFLQVLNPVSEPLYALVFFGALACAVRGPRGLLLGALLIGILPLARSAGVTAVAGFVLWLAVMRELPTGRRALLAAIAVAPYAAWTVFRSALGVQGYATFISLEVVDQAFGGWSGLLLDQPLRMFDAYVSSLDDERGILAVFAVAIALIPAIVGGVRRLFARRLDAYCVPPYLALCFIWPYPAETDRLLLVMWPAYVLWAWDGLCFLVAKLRGGEASRVLPFRVALALSIALLAGAAPALAGLFANASREEVADLAPFKRRSYYLLTDDPVEARALLEIDAYIVGTLGAVPQVVPTDACIYAEVPSLVWLYTGRQAALIPPDLDLASPVEPQLRQCDYFFVTGLATAQHGVSGDRLLQEITAFADPVFAGFVGPDADDETKPRRVAAALLQRRPAP